MLPRIASFAFDVKILRRKSKGFSITLARILIFWSFGGRSIVNGFEARISPDTLGAVSSESKICSEIGLGLLKRGVRFCGSEMLHHPEADHLNKGKCCRRDGRDDFVCWSGMQHSGIGGGGFMLVRNAEGGFEAIDFRETAPASAFQDIYKNNVTESIKGGLASGVPGDLRGLEYLHNKYGVGNTSLLAKILPWRVVFNPAVHIARNGFPVTEDLVLYMHRAMTHYGPFLTDDPSWAVDFAPNGTLLGLHDILTRKRYASTLERIGQYGAKEFYEGEIANYTIAALQTANGIMTLEDLKSYKVVIRDPVQITYRNYTVTSCGTPSGGSVALSILKIIEGYEMSNPSQLNLSTHRLDEAMRFSYAARSELGDPDFFAYMKDLEAHMLRAEVAAGIRGRILDRRTCNVSHYSPLRYSLPENHGTSHIVATDSTGMTITLTTTVNLLFGSLVVVPESGIIMNNEMNDFSIPGVENEFGFVPSPINYIAPGKRPLSSTSPIIVTHSNGSFYIGIGAAGGSRIVTSTVQALWHILDHGMTLPDALAQARFHDQLLPDRTTFETGFDLGTVAAMKARLHKVLWVDIHQSAVQGVRRLWNGTFEAASEPRQKNSGGLAM